MWQKCIIKYFAFVVNSVISISVHFCPVLFIYSDLRPYMTHQNFQGGMLWAGSVRFVQCQILTPVSWTSPPQNEPPTKNPSDFKGAPWQILCTGPRIPSDCPGCRQEWLLRVWRVLLLAVIMKIAVVIYSRHLSGWRGLRLVLKGKKTNPPRST